MTPTPDFSWLFVKMVIGLILVLGLALVLFRYVLPRFGLGQRRGRGLDWAFVEDVVRIDPHRSLFLVKILERHFVLGASEHSLSVITELSAADSEKIAGGGKS